MWYLTSLNWGGVGIKLLMCNKLKMYARQAINVDRVDTSFFEFSNQVRRRGSAGWNFDEYPS